MELTFYENMTLYRHHRNRAPKTFVGFIFFMAAAITFIVAANDEILIKFFKNKILRKIIKVILVILSVIFLVISVIADK